LKVELHCHTSRYSGCATATPEAMVRAMVEAGYGAAYLTEHDTVWPEDALAALQADHPAIRLFPGVELTVGTESFAHLLVLGTCDPSYLQIRHVQDVVARAREDGHLTVLAHAFRYEDEPDTRHLLESGWRPDALEHRTNNQDGPAAATAAEVAGRLGIPLVNTGDLHSLDMVGKFWIECDAPLAVANDIRRVILDGAYGNRAFDA
jgi:hypothetical protein